MQSTKIFAVFLDIRVCKPSMQNYITQFLKAVWKPRRQYAKIILTCLIYFNCNWCFPLSDSL